MIKNLEKSKNNKPHVYAVVGATASGKTAFSIKLAKELGGEIISADSRLVYKGFNIACAKPTLEERQGIPHYMMDVAEPEYDYSAGLYAQQAKIHIYDILNRGKVPIVVGGTGLYFRLLLENFNPPKVKPDYELRNKLKILSSDELYNMLTELDEEGAKSLESKNDKKKLIRLIEIVKNGGMPLSAQRGVSEESEFDVVWIGKNYPRDVLYDRINKRVDIMLENGMVEETKYLLKKHGRIPNLICTIGYKEIISYLDGNCSLNESLELLKQNSGKYAKRQLTWFRKNPYIQWDCYPELIVKNKKQ